MSFGSDDLEHKETGESAEIATVSARGVRIAQAFDLVIGSPRALEPGEVRATGEDDSHRVVDGKSRHESH